MVKLGEAAVESKIQHLCLGFAVFTMMTCFISGADLDLLMGLIFMMFTLFCTWEYQLHIE